MKNLKSNFYYNYKYFNLIKQFKVSWFMSRLTSFEVTKFHLKYSTLTLKYKFTYRIKLKKIPVLLEVSQKLLSYITYCNSQILNSICDTVLVLFYYFMSYNLQS